VEDRTQKTLETFRADLESLDLSLPAPPRGEGSFSAIDLPPADKVEPLEEIRRLLAPAPVPPARRRPLGPLLPGALVLVSAAAMAALFLRRPAPTPEGPILSIPFPAQTPVGLAISRGAFFSVDARTREMVKLDPGSSRVIEKTSFPAEKPDSIACVGPHLWVADAESRSVLRYRVDEGLRYDGSADLSWALPPGGTLAGLAYDGAWVWLLTASPSALHRIPIGRLRFS